MTAQMTLPWVLEILALDDEDDTSKKIVEEEKPAVPSKNDILHDELNKIKRNLQRKLSEKAQRDAKELQQVREKLEQIMEENASYEYSRYKSLNKNTNATAFYDDSSWNSLDKDAKKADQDNLAQSLKEELNTFISFLSCRDI